MLKTHTLALTHTVLAQYPPYVAFSVFTVVNAFHSNMPDRTMQESEFLSYGKYEMNYLNVGGRIEVMLCYFILKIRDLLGQKFGPVQRCCTSALNEMKTSME